jgi:tight adherence protein C
MLLLALLALCLAGAAVALAGWAIVLPRTRSAARMHALEAYGYGAVARGGSPARSKDDAQRRPLTAAINRLGQLAARHVGTVREERLRDELLAAGLYTLSPHMLLGYRVIAAGGLTSLLLVSSLIASPALRIVAAVFLGWLGWVTPLVFVRRRARLRLLRIDQTLPDLVELLVVTVEAGLGFAGSLQVASQRIHGPLGDELRLAIQEQKLGRSLKDALEQMLSRAETPAMRSFVRGVTQGEALGVSIGTIMRNLAHEMRARRRSRAEERANKAPVKMLFPLIFCIFPSLFVVILGPAVLQIANAGLT